MSDSVSISFKNGDQESVILTSDWSCFAFLDDIVIYHSQLVKTIKEQTAAGNIRTPLFRKEPNTVMVDFIRWLTKRMRVVETDYHMSAKKNSGEMGHCTFDLNTGQFDRMPEYVDDDAEYDEDGNRIRED